jgi:putative MATE family efflux protein
MMAGFLVHGLYIAVDAYFIGKLGSMALAASTYVGALFFLANAVSSGLMTGITATVAQAVGRRSEKEATIIASNVLGFGLVVGVAFAGLSLAFGKQLMPVLGAEGEAADLAWEYFKTLSYGMPILFYGSSIRAVLTGEGDAKTPMKVLVFATVLNAVLDPIFIFTLGMGIRGASLATVVAMLSSSSILSYVAFIRRRSFVRFGITLLGIKARVIGPVLRIGLPVTLGLVVMAVGLAFINRVVSEFGQIAVTGYGAASKVDIFVALPVLGLSSATVAVIGMFAGAGRVDLVRFTAFYAYKWIFIVVMVLGTGALLASTWIVGLFTVDAQAIAIGTNYLKYMVLGYPLMAIGMMSGRILQGIGQGTPTLIFTFIRVLLIGVPVAYIAVYWFDTSIDWVWGSGIAGGFISNAIAVWWVYEYVWKRDPTRLIAVKKIHN